MITIQKWSETFETADTRKRQTLGYFGMPSGCRSSGYRKLARKGAIGFLSLGVFTALCQLMATMPKEVRKAGKFANSDGSEMDLEDIADLILAKNLPGSAGIAADSGTEVADFACDEKCFKMALLLLVEVQWITLQSAGRVPVACRSRAGRVPKNSGFVNVDVDVDVHDDDDDDDAPPKKKPPRASAPVVLDLPHSNRFEEAWSDWQEHRSAKRQKLTPQTIKLQLARLGAMTEAEAVATIENTIEKGWTGLREPDPGPDGATGNRNAIGTSKIVYQAGIREPRCPPDPNETFE